MANTNDQDFAAAAQRASDQRPNDELIDAVEKMAAAADEARRFAKAYSSGKTAGSVFQGSKEALDLLDAARAMRVAAANQARAAADLAAATKSAHPQPSTGGSASGGAPSAASHFADQQDVIRVALSKQAQDAMKAEAERKAANAAAMQAPPPSHAAPAEQGAGPAPGGMGAKMIATGTAGAMGLPLSGMARALDASAKGADRLFGAIGKGTASAAQHFEQMRGQAMSLTAAASPVAYDTLTKSMQLLSATVGQAVLPYIMSAAKWFQQAAAWVKGLDSATKDSVVKWASYAAAVFAVGYAINKLAGVFGNLMAAIKIVSSGLTLLLGNPFVAGIAVILAGVLAIAYAFGLWGKSVADVEQQSMKLDQVLARIRAGERLRHQDMQAFTPEERRRLDEQRNNPEGRQKVAEQIAQERESKVKSDEEIAKGMERLQEIDAQAGSRSLQQMQADRILALEAMGIPWEKQMNDLAGSGVGDDRAQRSQLGTAKIQALGDQAHQISENNRKAAEAARGTGKQGAPESGKKDGGGPMLMAADKSMTPQYFSTMEQASKAIQMASLSVDSLDAAILAEQRQGNASLRQIERNTQRDDREPPPSPRTTR